MWIATKYGWFSMVRAHDGIRFMVRARRKSHLEELIYAMDFLKVSNTQIVETVHTDYKFRIFITEAQLKMIMLEMVEDLDYSNFKNEAKEFQEGRQVEGTDNYIESLHQVWWEMLYMGQDKKDEEYVDSN